MNRNIDWTGLKCKKGRTPLSENAVQDRIAHEQLSPIREKTPGVEKALAPEACELLDLSASVKMEELSE